MQTGWKNKLEQWAPEPPAMVWERLSEQLEDKPLFAQKLHGHSAVPPAGAWQAILNRMEPETVTTPVIRMLPRNKWIRYGSVAASLLFAFFLFRVYGPSPNAGSTVQGARPVHNTIISLPLPEDQQSDTRVNQSNGNDLASRANPLPGRISYPPVPDVITDPIPQPASARYTSNRLQEVVPINFKVEDGLLERYILVSVGEDAAARLPKKLYDLFRCGEVPLPEGCTEWVKQMRQRAASPTLVTNADFAGVLEIVQQMDK